MTDENDPARGRAGASPDFAGAILAGRYRILRKLGEGAMGGVYLGEHLKIGRQDAIKVLRGGLAHDAESIARFRRGARNLSQIRHPNVCTLYDYGETEDGSPFLALEFVTGETLNDIIARERRLEPARALRIARQTADALSAAHEAGIVHRDLKPSNIMIERARDGGDSVKVVDFDIAKGSTGLAGDELTSVDVVVGTPEYMSPEQLTGEPLDGRSDLYSLGIVLFRMLSGAYPFRSRGAPAIMTERMTAQPLTLAEAFPQGAFAPAFQRVLDRALARNRDERYARAADFAADLTALEQNLRAKTQETTEAATLPWVPAPPGGPGTGPWPPQPTEAPTQPWLPQPPPTRAASVPAAPTEARPLSGNGRLRLAAWIGAGLAVIAGAAVLFVVLENGPAAQDGDGTEIGDGGRGTPVGGKEGGEIVDSPKIDSVHPPPAGITVDAARAEDVLLGLLDVFTRYGSSAVPSATLQAVHDTAHAFYGSAAVASRDRALAAYLVANYHWLRGERSECRDWMENALALDPTGPGYPQLLEKCSGGPP